MRWSGKPPMARRRTFPCFSFSCSHKPICTRSVRSPTAGMAEGFVRLRRLFRRFFRSVSVASTTTPDHTVQYSDLCIPASLQSLAKTGHEDIAGFPTPPSQTPTLNPKNFATPLVPTSLTAQTGKSLKPKALRNSKPKRKQS